MGLRKVFFVLRNFFKYLKSGGVVYAQVSQISHGQILKDKRVIITGGTSGIGFAIAKKFISEGANVLIIGRSDKNLTDAYNLLNHKVEILNWDLASLDDIDLKMQEAVQKLGGLDILVNNAGVYENIDFLDVSLVDWDKMMSLNLKSVFFVSQKAVQYLEKPYSKIINISSIAGFQGYSSPYGISKAGLNNLTKGLAKKLLPKNIIVNAIAPGNTATKMTGFKADDNIYDTLGKNGRTAIPEEIAELACFLASDSANNIVGQVIVCDGGALLK